MVQLLSFQNLRWLPLGNMWVQNFYKPVDHLYQSSCGHKLPCDLILVQHCALVETWKFLEGIPLDSGEWKMDNTKKGGNLKMNSIQVVWVFAPSVFAYLVFDDVWEVRNDFSRWFPVLWRSPSVMIPFSSRGIPGWSCWQPTNLNR